MSITPTFEVGKTYRTAGGELMKLTLIGARLLGVSEGTGGWCIIYHDNGTPFGAESKWQLLPGAIEDENSDGYRLAKLEGLFSLLQSHIRDLAALAAWNDAPERTLEEVLAAYDKAIAAAEESEKRA